MSRIRALPSVQVLLKMSGPQEVSAGVFEDAVNEDTGRPVAEYAAYNEFGTARVPARAFMHTAFANCRNAWTARLQRKLSGGVTPEAAMTDLGRQMQNDIVASINQKFGPWAPNKPATALRKRLKEGGSKPPLYDTGSLIKSIRYTVGPGAGA